VLFFKFLILYGSTTDLVEILSDIFFIVLVQLPKSQKEIG